jgi:hypothetical protein
MSEHEMREQVAYYNGLVAQYEKLDEEIRMLLSDAGGKTGNLRENNLARYRELATQRDDIHSEMRSLEQILFPEEQ